MVKNIKTTDELPVVIIGSGLAGLTVALEIADKRKVLILSKKDLFCSATAWAQGGIVNVVDNPKSIQTHVSDTIKAGDGLVNESVAKCVAKAGNNAMKWLLKKGVLFSLEEEKSQKLHLVKEGGHSVPRIAHAADATGKAILNALLEKARNHPNIEIRTGWIGIDLIDNRNVKQNTIPNQKIHGVYALDIKNQKIKGIEAIAVVLATGGVGKVYRYTSNPDTATGDGIAMAWRAGCRVANMEFMQFHPTCLYHSEERTFLLSEALRGAGASLELPSGKRFMKDYDTRGDLASRDIVARSIDFEMKKNGLDYIYLNATKIKETTLKEHFPNISNKCLKLGINITKERIPAVPAAHYICGGIVTNLDGLTDISGLYAIGETAYTGLHGANRLASNSLLECVVIGINAAKHILTQPKKNKVKIREWSEFGIVNSDESVVISHNWDELRLMMWNYVGIVRTDKRLQRAINRIRLLREEIHDYYKNHRINLDLLELRNLVTCSELIVRSAIGRRESRGLHYSHDNPTNFPVAVPTILTPHNLGKLDYF
ncbi:MAG: L-aspartate oxidase [Betaproteobacteria bacterium TMED156]|nr:MAG: L-aspartate oxidase [Betaproteobacteria bacterium TMED156]